MALIKMNEAQPRFNLKTSEAAKLCRLSALTLSRKIKAGKLIENIHFIQTDGGHRLYNHQMLVSWMDCGRRTDAPAHIEAMQAMAQQTAKKAKRVPRKS